MGSQVNPCIMFGGNARQALEFYREVFGGELQVATAADFGAPSPGGADKVMHARLDTAAGYTLMGWDHPDDRPGHPPYRPGNNVAVFLDGDTDAADELRGYFDKLSVGGTITLPLEKQVWGDEAGSLVDRFGIHWMFNIA
ncbi:VOC family protein [Nocardia wallacei]|uniref:VOC family protein n=1 Tax=Nocardia wallacei TaxID=480035 RepID=UPI002453D593|nr:VOC family protein [Nocardia wallacei]